MLNVLPARLRGHTQIEWLDSYHSFSFGGFYNPRQLGFRKLRVINEDRVQPGQGFDTHPHSDMEIISYVLEGSLQHRDSLGTGSIIQPGDVQRMSAGTGVFHSEFNPSPGEDVHFLQIWIFPERKGLAPSYEQKHFDAAQRQHRFRLVASHDGREGSVTVHQDVSLYAGLFRAGESAVQELAANRHAWLQLVRGAATLNGTEIRRGDGVAVSEEQELRLDVQDDAEVLLFDLA